VSRIGIRELVVFNFSNLYRQHEFARKLCSSIGGFEGALPDTYGMSAEKLNEWRRRSLRFGSNQ
jgi:hypothetical protein